MIKIASILNSRIEQKADHQSKVDSLESTYSDLKAQFEAVLQKILAFVQKQFRNNVASIDNLYEHTPSERVDRRLNQSHKSDSLMIEENIRLLNDPEQIKLVLELLSSPICNFRSVDSKGYFELKSCLRSKNIINEGNKDMAQPRVTLLYDIDRSTSTLRCFMFIIIALIICAATCFLCVYFLD